MGIADSLPPHFVQFKDDNAVIEAAKRASRAEVTAVSLETMNLFEQLEVPFFDNNHLWCTSQLMVVM